MPYAVDFTSLFLESYFYHYCHSLSYVSLWFLFRVLWHSETCSPDSPFSRSLCILPNADKQTDPCQALFNNSQGWCTGKTQRNGMEREAGGGSGWGTRVNPWLIHVNVWQKPLQYCKVISLQRIKINGKKIVFAHSIDCFPHFYWNISNAWYFLNFGPHELS